VGDVALVAALPGVLPAVPAADADEPTPVTGTHGVVVGVAVGDVALGVLD
jgi:hypothetical protein